MAIIKNIPIQTWNSTISAEVSGEAIRALEHGHIIILPKLPFTLNAEENALLSPKLTLPNRKHIQFNSHTGNLHGAKALPQQQVQLKNILRRYYQHTLNLILSLLPHYQQHVLSGRTHLSTIEIGKTSRFSQKEQPRLRIDAFTATPMHGRRILRVFTNINPNHASQVWQIGEPFTTLAKRFIPEIPSMSAAEQYLLKFLKVTKTPRSQYDHFMLSIRNKMRKDSEYQHSIDKKTIELLPGSTWMMFADQVSHATLSGQHLLEQTFYLPIHAMQYPETSPLHILETLLAQPLIKKEKVSTTIG
jgi:hypothetical protein